MYKLSKRSLRNLKGVHPDLVQVVKEAIRITRQDFTVIEGLRSIERQRELVNKGMSKTMNSRHLTGHAVDIIPYPIPGDWSRYTKEHWDDVYNSMKIAAQSLGVKLNYGYEWGWDKPHYQLDWKDYPK